MNTVSKLSKVSTILSNMSKVSRYCATSISYSKVSNMSKFSGCDTVDIRK